MCVTDVHHREYTGNGLLVFRLQIKALQVKETVETKQQFLAALSNNRLHHLHLRCRHSDICICATQSLGTQTVHVTGCFRQVVQTGVGLSSYQIHLSRTQTHRHIGETLRRSGWCPDGSARTRIKPVGDAGTFVTQEEAIAQVVALEQALQLRTDHAIVVKRHLFAGPTRSHPHIAEYLRVIVAVVVLAESHTTSILNDIVVYQRCIQAQRRLGSLLGFLPVAVEQIDLCQQTVAVCLVRVIDIGRFLFQQRNRFLQFTDDEVINLGYRRLCRR